MSLVIVDTDEYIYSNSEGHGRGFRISLVLNYEHPQIIITKERNGMYHIAGKYGKLGWVYPSAIITFL